MENASQSFSILYQDDHLVAINKPTGYFVHRSALDPKAPVVMQQLRDQLGQRVYPVHRLDRATSGVLLFALNKFTADQCMQAFQNRRIEKQYLLVARGYTEDEGVIDYPLARHQQAPEREAITHYQTLARCEQPWAIGRYPTSRYSLVLARPKTGRHHQLRRHFAHIRHPIVGDTTHGEGRHNRAFREHFGIHRMLLHACTLQFSEIASKRIRIQAPFDQHVFLHPMLWSDEESGGALRSLGHTTEKG